MRAYFAELRQKMVQAGESGISKSQAAGVFAISLSSVKRYARADGLGEALALPKKGGGRPLRADQNTNRLFERDIAERPVPIVDQR